MSTRRHSQDLLREDGCLTPTEAVERELAGDAQWKLIQKNTFTRWTNDQKNTFTRWTNEHLKTVDCEQ